MNTLTENIKNEELLLQLQSLESRISNLEYKVNNFPTGASPGRSPVEGMGLKKKTEEEEDALEYRIGEFLFAKTGVLIFVIGIIFLLTFPYSGVSSYLPSLTGYIIAVVLFLLSMFLNKSIPHISTYLITGGICIFYFSTLRLYYLSSQPVITDFSTEIALLSLCSLGALVLSIRLKSVYLVALSMMLGSITALASNSSYFIPNALVILSVMGIILSGRYNWTKLSVFVIVLTYFTYMTWLINNPFFTGTLKLANSETINSVYLLLYMLIFSLFYKTEKSHDEMQLVLMAVLNVVLGYGLLLISALKLESFVYLNIITSLIFLFLSAYFYLRINSKYLTFIYAMSGYMALSAAILSQYKAPDAFILLCWQSLLVVSTAIWFRSRPIVIANFIIFLFIILTYLVINNGIDAGSLSFGIVCLLSARIMNWQKERLELKTEQMRNAYLLIALFIIPFSLYHTVPKHYVAFSWIGASMLYYVLSRLLNTKKYRWMALITLAVTILYVFIQGFSGSDSTDRIVLFLVLGVVLVSVSITYALLKNRALLKK